MSDGNIRKGGIGMSKYFTFLGLLFMGGSMVWAALKIGPPAAPPIIFILGTVIYLAGKMNNKTQSE